MDETLKISLMELIIGVREPQTGIEVHFLKVIKKQARACTPEEKCWYEWWLSTQEKGLEVQKVKAKIPKKIKTPIYDNKSERSNIPERAKKILDSIGKFNSDALSKRRLPGSYGSGKKSR
ncbi:hypothetical protein MCEKH45_01944 [Methylophilaceae bacterium]|jgi:hypothetical protein